MKSEPAKVLMENPNSPDRTIRVDADKYQSMRDALLCVLPTGSPGLTVANAKAGISKPVLLASGQAR